MPLSDDARALLCKDILRNRGVETHAVIAKRNGVGEATVDRYTAKLRHAGEISPVAPKPQSAQERFWQKVDQSGNCWLWTAGRTSHGYGSFWSGTRAVKAHQFAYESLVGPCPWGTELDHTCHNRLCVRPDPEHVRAATRKQNMENRRGPTARSASGVRGVSWHKASGKWIAKLRHHKKDIHIGYFIDLAEAERAVVAKRNELYTHNSIDRYCPPIGMDL